jgi:hypothetical protein
VEETRSRVVYNWLQYYEPETLVRELDDVGFHVAELLGNVSGDALDETSPEFAIVATVAPQ